MKKLIKISTYAKMIDVSTQRVYQMIGENQLPDGVKSIEIDGRRFIKLPKQQEDKK